MEKWKIKVEYRSKLTLKDSKFIFEQAEKSFNDTIETSKRVLDRTNTTLQIVVGLLIALVAYSINKFQKENVLDSNLITAIVGILYYLFLSIFFLIPNIKPITYDLPGTQPNKLFIDKIYNVEAKEDERLLWLYAIEIENLQNRISRNESINTKRWKKHSYSIRMLMYSPIVLFLVYAALSYKKI